MSMKSLSRVAATPRCHGRISTVIARRLSASTPDLEDAASIQAEKSPKDEPKTRPIGFAARKRTIFSGIQPTGIPHLGNYLGALRQWKQLQDQKISGEIGRSSRLFFCVVDLHALTHRQSPVELWQSKRDTLASLLAIGLDPKHSDIFFQSEVPQHAQLMWYLSNSAGFGALSRMTQWKSKLGISEDDNLTHQNVREKMKLALYAYPVLQAADILLYGTDLVPVGHDQVQHIEFTRHLARGFNQQYPKVDGNKMLFKIPEAVISPARRIMSLTEPTTKMSKSHPHPDSRILITDSADEIRRKLKGALTDSIEGITYDPKTRPGVSNLIQILKHVSSETATCEELASDLQTQSMLALKEHVAEQVIRSLSGIAERFRELSSPKNQTLLQAQKRGRNAAKTEAARTLEEVERAIGLKSGPIHKTKPNASSAAANKERVMHEQMEEERDQVDEPDVVPQSSEGVDRPIAS